MVPTGLSQCSMASQDSHWRPAKSQFTKHWYPRLWVGGNLPNVAKEIILCSQFGRLVVPFASKLRKGRGHTRILRGLVFLSVERTETTLWLCIDESIPAFSEVGHVAVVNMVCHRMVGIIGTALLELGS